jgi:hypothetical protein
MSNNNGTLFCLGCISVLGGRNRLIKQIAFFPPSKPGYIIHSKTSEVLVVGDESLNTYPISQLIAQSGLLSVGVPAPEIKFHHLVISAQYTFIKRVIHGFAFINSKSQGLTLVFSHGNSTDIGYSALSYIKLCELLSVNVVCYDYAGYGLNKGQPTEANIKSDIRSVIQHVVEKLHIPPSKIILYGQSVGSGPSVDVAADVRFRLKYPIGGLILHSAMASGLRFFYDFKDKKSPWFDLFRNVEKCKSGALSDLPTFIFHGADDEEVRFKLITAGKVGTKFECGRIRLAIMSATKITPWLSMS